MSCIIHHNRTKQPIICPWPFQYPAVLLSFHLPLGSAAFGPWFSPLIVLPSSSGESQPVCYWWVNVYFYPKFSPKHLTPVTEWLLKISTWMFSSSSISSSPNWTHLLPPAGQFFLLYVVSLLSPPASVPAWTLLFPHPVPHKARSFHSPCAMLHHRPHS